MSETSTSRSPSGNRPARSRVTPIPRRSSTSASSKVTSTCRSSRDLLQRGGEGLGDRGENVATCAGGAVDRGVEQAMQAGHAKEVRIARRMDVAQLADRGLV